MECAHGYHCEQGLRDTRYFGGQCRNLFNEVNVLPDCFSATESYNVGELLSNVDCSSATESYDVGELLSNERVNQEFKLFSS